ncbi:M56 family metallopeptidase [Altererythrobacter sp.]|uniref:M56 family metallopeptidase n=1 Tax=Altererythrobacter sp. TaxID=1872480 RepID=UPI003D0641C2
MMDWLLDTIVWTAALIALVLVLRRPVARWFGPQVAYALWAMPILRLALPPIELPAWMAPVPALETLPVTADAQMVPITFLAEPAIQSAPEPTSWLANLPLTEIAVSAWLIGAAVFLFVRFNGYFQMRGEMLDGAREVGRAGKVRLVETPATTAPLAFGLRDKVVALPVGFMAHYDRQSRDLALAHELSHHRGGDLLVNFVAQPLFAMHWFNPLAQVGWLALRRDQEAACDARVISERDAEERATYASVIAGFAAGPHAALAAPMACPILGEKSIIQRLRSLKMNEYSARRRLAGRGLIVAALVALPLTASISYAEVPAPPEPPVAPSAPVAPVAPVPPTPPAAPDAPLPPVPPAPPAPVEFQAATEVVAPEDGKDIRKERIVIRKVHSDRDSSADTRHVHREFRTDTDARMSREEREEMLRDLRESLAEMDLELAEAKQEMHIALMELDDARDGLTKIKVTCKGGGEGVELRMKDGETVSRICTSEIMASALAGIKEARKHISEDGQMPEDIRADVLKSLDEQIAKMSRKAS